MARQRHRRLVLDGREHGDMLTSAGVKVLSEVNASCWCPGWVPHRAGRRAKLAVSRLTEVTCTTVPAGTEPARVRRAGTQAIFGTPQSNSVPSLQMQ